MYTIVENIVLYLGYIMEGYIAFEYLNSVFPQKKKLRIITISFFVGFSLLFAVYLLNNTYINSIAHIITLFSIIIFCYEYKIGAMIFHTTIFIVMIMLTEMVSVPMLNTIYGENYMNTHNSEILMYSSTIAKLLLLLVCKIITKFAQKESTHSKYSYLLFLLPIATAANTLLVAYLAKGREYSIELNILIAVICTLLLTSNVLVFILYEHSIRAEQDLSMLRLSEQKSKLDYEYYKIIEQRIAQSRMMAHDVKHHFGVLYSMISVSDNDEAKEYIQSYLNNQEFLVSETFDTGNRIADVIVNNKYNVCMNIGISFYVKHNNVDLSFVEDPDLCCILSNLIDNAIEAAQLSQNKKVKVELFESENKNIKFIEVTNSCDEKPIYKNSRFISTKSQKNGKDDLHGIGLISVKSVVKKYDGILRNEYIASEKMFDTVVMLQCPIKEDEYRQPINHHSFKKNNYID